MQQLITIGQTSISDSVVQTVNARDLHAFIESKQEFSNWIKGRIEQYGFVADQDFTVDTFINGRKQTDYYISIDMAKELAMVERNARGKEARQYFIECERKVLSAPVAALPDFSNPAAAARAWADEIDAKNAALALAGHAIATKAEIGNRREATAMNTASQAVKKATALEIELDRSKLFASVKRMEMLYHGQKFEWRKLKSGGQEMGIEPIEIFDANYGTVKAYHADVWREVYALPIEVVACEGVAA